MSIQEQAREKDEQRERLYTEALQEKDRLIDRLMGNDVGRIATTETGVNTEQYKE